MFFFLDDFAPIKFFLNAWSFFQLQFCNTNVWICKEQFKILKFIKNVNKISLLLSLLKLGYKPHLFWRKKILKKKLFYYKDSGTIDLIGQFCVSDPVI